MSYFIKRPGKVRRSYALIGPDGKTIEDKRIDKVNEDLKRGMAGDLLEERMRLVKLEYQNKYKPPVLTAFGNLELANQVQAWKLKRKPYLRDPGSSLAALIRAVEACGMLSLYTASEEQLLGVVAREPDLFKQQYLKRDLNQLLRHAKRDFTLKVVKLKRVGVVRFLSLDAFLQRLTPVKNDIDRLYMKCLFATGCRYAELPCMQLLGSGIVVQEQINRKGQFAVTKNNRQREAPVIPELLPDVKIWVEQEMQEKIRIRLERYKFIYRASKDHLKMTVHDLRHCYAVRWRQHGFTPGQIAEFIGDTEDVCREHYLRFGGDSDAVKLAVAQYQAAQKVKK